MKDKLEVIKLRKKLCFQTNFYVICTLIFKNRSLSIKKYFCKPNISFKYIKNIVTLVSIYL